MLRALRSLLIATLLFPVSLHAAGAAQQGDAAYFESFDGLQRVVARSWSAPLTLIESFETVDLNPEGTPIGTPIVSTPSATPAPQAGVGSLSIFVFLFDSDENAEAGFERIDEELATTVLRDPRAPMMDDLPLDDIGDDAVGYMGELAIDDIPVTYTFATVLDGPFVYSLSGMFGGAGGAVDAAGLTYDYAASLVTARMDRMAEQFHEDGTSRGGIWSKLAGVEPEMPEGSTTMDFIIWPMPEGQMEDDTTVGSMEDLAAVENIESVHGMTYLPGDDAVAGGPARIDAWIVETPSQPDAEVLIYVVSGILGEPILATASQNAFESDGDTLISLVALEGFVTDDTLPEGDAALVVQQVGDTIYAAVVYAPDGTARRIADNVVLDMIEAPADGDVTSRLPQEGDGVLRGLVPSGSPNATPVASPEASTPAS